MSLLVIGLSHHTAPLGVLEGLAEDGNRAQRIANHVLGSASVSETLVLSTCNRLEVYADVSAFHPAVAAIGEALAGAAKSHESTLAEHLYVRYDDSAVAHAFTVASGLDSMAVGESQILGQMRESLASAQALGAAGESLNDLFQQALRVGKRAHSETDIDRHSVSLVQIGLERALAHLGPLEGIRACVVGAGGMSGLAVATAVRAGVGDMTIVNRTAARAARLAEAAGGTHRHWDDLPEVIAENDLVITSTGAVGHVITAADIERSAALRDGRPQLFVDLALPRDVEPVSEWQREVPGVEVIDLQALSTLLEGRADSQQVRRVSDLVTGEVAAFLTRRREKAVAPTVAALRSRAAQVVAAEMGRLDLRLPELDDAARAEVALAVHRIVEKLLHTPTKRVKEFATEAGGADYAAALRELFDLEPKDVANVSTPPKRVG
jgi:glutamyl-tRNA reductase